MHGCSRERIAILTTMLVLFAVALTACGNGNDNDDETTAGAPIEFRCAAPANSAGGVGFVQDGGVVSLVPPYSLARTTAGVSISVFPQDAGLLENLMLQVHVASRRHLSPECTVVITLQNPPAEPLRLRVGAREGIAVRVSQADLVEAVELLRTSPSAGNCADVTEPGDLALAGLVVSPGEAGVSLSLDAVAIGRTAETLPTAETSPPACLQP